MSIDNMLITRDGNEHIANSCSLKHGHHPITIHHGLKRSYWINFGYDDVRSHPIGPTCKTPTTPAIAANHNCSTGQQNVGRSNNAVERRLPGSISVIKHMLGHRFIDSNDWVLEHTFRSHSL